MLPTLIAVFASTFVSEDLACIAAGSLIARGDVSATAGVLACALGIFIGDLGLWVIGRFGRHVALMSSWISRHLSRALLDRGSHWLTHHAGAAIVASRFTPGTRLPLYVTAGLVRMSPFRFAAWTFVAVMLWTPAIVLGGAHVGRTFAPVAPWSAVAFIAATLVLARSAIALGSTSRRSALADVLRRRLRWEFWPPWLFYAPVAMWVLALAVRHRGIAVITASNPGIADGGVVGESKFDILKRLPAEWTIPSARLAVTTSANRCRQALAIMNRESWTFPIVLKPDVGQRGVGVELIESTEQLDEYLTRMSGAVLLQPYHAGPYEAGVFYYRRPDQAKGQIFSIADKRFPIVIGDGQHTLAQLIDDHPRYRLQGPLFLRKHRRMAERVLADGEVFRLTIAGNHAQGTTFYDGAYLKTPELEARIDAIAQEYRGFFIGRFDVRYQDVDAFKAGRDLAIVELNGATGESTNIYDPSASLFSAYRTLFAQWSLVFAIGAANRALGAAPTPPSRLARLVLAHLTA